MGELFNGTWTIDLNTSSVWDDVHARHVKDEVGAEIITLEHNEGIQEYEVVYGDSPRIRMGYRARFDDAQWVPYCVREIISTAADVAADLAAFKRRIKSSEGERERHFEVGRPYGLVRLVYVDARTHYRISKNPRDGSAQSIMLRRLADDEQSYISAVLDTNGIVYRVRRFTRV